MLTIVKARFYPQIIYFSILISLVLIFMQNVPAQSESANVPSGWQTWVEKTNYLQTPRYAETVEYAKKLAAASDWIVYQSFGKTGENRDLPILIAAKDKDFTSEAARYAH